MELGRPRALVIGDLILDSHVGGTVTRVSPEAPIPVLLEEGEKRELAGGAANVAANLAAQGAFVSVVGLVGDDRDGCELLRLGELSGVDLKGVVRDPSRPTTRKTRFVADARHLLRVDRESSAEPSDLVRAQLRRAAVRAASVSDVVVLSDYRKGVIDRALVEAVLAVAGCPVLVDPKGGDSALYAGVAAAKPNQGESFDLSGFDDPAVASSIVRALLGCKAVLVTCGARGAWLSVDDEDEPLLVEATPVRPVDVTGAGDTAMAVFAMAVASGKGWASAARLAVDAATMSVTREGVHVVGRRELQVALGGTVAKMVSEKELIEDVRLVRARGGRVAWTNGCFDLLHAGHLSTVTRAAGMADFLVVAINSDSSVRRIKGAGRPVVGEMDRAAAIAALSCVDRVVIFDEDTPVRLIASVVPDVIVKGGDWNGAGGVVGASIVEQAGGSVAYAPVLPGLSTTRILEGMRPEGAT